MFNRWRLRPGSGSARRCCGRRSRATSASSTRCATKEMANSRALDSGLIISLIAQVAKDRLGEPLPLDHSPIKFGSWMGGDSRRRDCHFTDTPCLSLLKHLIKVQGCSRMTVSSGATRTITQLESLASSEVGRPQRAPTYFSSGTSTCGGSAENRGDSGHIVLLAAHICDIPRRFGPFLNAVGGP